MLRRSLPKTYTETIALDESTRKPIVATGPERCVHDAGTVTSARGDSSPGSSNELEGLMKRWFASAGGSVSPATRCLLTSASRAVSGRVTKISIIINRSVDPF